MSPLWTLMHSMVEKCYPWSGFMELVRGDFRVNRSWRQWDRILGFPHNVCCHLVACRIRNLDCICLRGKLYLNTGQQASGQQWCYWHTLFCVFRQVFDAHSHSLRNTYICYNVLSAHIATFFFLNTCCFLCHMRVKNENSPLLHTPTVCSRISPYCALPLFIDYYCNVTM